MANEPNHGIVVPFARKAPQTITIKVMPQSTASLAEAYQAVFEAKPPVANANGLGDLEKEYSQFLTLTEYSKPEMLNRELHCDGERFITDVHMDIVEHYRNSGTARQAYHSFMHLTHGVLVGLEDYIRMMAMGGCDELVPLLHSIMDSKDKAGTALYTLGGAK